MFFPNCLNFPLAAIKHCNQPQITIQMEEGECKQTIFAPYFAYLYFGHVYLFIKLLYMNKSTRNIPNLLVTDNLKII